VNKWATTSCILCIITEVYYITIKNNGVVSDNWMDIKVPLGKKS